MDMQWIKHTLQNISKEQETYLVFEVPKNGKDLKNDVENITYFQNL